MFQRRLGIVYAVACAGLVLIGGRLFCLQVLQMTADDPDMVLHRPVPLGEIPAYRGAITDRNGEMIAGDRPVLNLAVRYETLRGSSGWVEGVCRATGRSREEIVARQRAVVGRVRGVKAKVMSARAARGLRPIRKIWEETIGHTVVSDISIGSAARIEADPKRFAGVVIRSAHRRAYPNGKVAPHVVGYLGRAARPRRGEVPEDPEVRPGDRIGKTGVEKAFNRLLHGRPGLRGRGAGSDAHVEAQEVLFPAQPGRTVFLTLDLAAQRAAEEALSGKIGAVVVMDVRTGGLLVMASSPGYDNGDIGRSLAEAAKHPEARILLSRAMQESVPPGSVMKPIVALAAAGRGVAGPETRFECAGAIMVGRRRFRCTGRHGTIAMTRAVEKSCNVYFFRLGLRAGPEAIVRMARDLGLGRRTGVDLPHEWPGRLPDPARARAAGRGWYGGDTANLSIGQGNLQVTPLQVAVAMGAVANGGKVLRPRVYLRAEPEPGPELLPEAGARVAREVRLPRDVLDAVRTGMRRAVVSGTARRVVGLRELGVAAKTGTAETPDPQVNHGWLAGFVPWDAPRYSFAVVVHRTPLHGASAAGPIAARVMEALLRHGSSAGGR